MSRRPNANGPRPAPAPRAPANPGTPANLTIVPKSSPGDDWVVDFADIEAFSKFKADRAPSNVLKKQWLASEPNWKYKIGKGWKGKRILGVGGQGIVGHWSYEGDDRDKKSVKDLAVKQALRAGMPSITP